MSLKEEIEKIIQLEQQKQELRDQKRAMLHERQRERFRLMRVLLVEIVASVEPAYVRARIAKDSAKIEVGEKVGDRFHKDITWKIEPIVAGRSSVKKEETLSDQEPGFLIEEMDYYTNPEYPSSNSQTLTAEQEVAKYLVKKMAERIAFHRRLRSKRGN